MVFGIIVALVLGASIGAAANSPPDSPLKDDYGQDDIWTIAPSNIHGEGVLSAREINAGELIGVGIRPRLGIPYITHMGSKTNHSYEPTAALRYDYATKSYNLYALNTIPPKTEITVDYRHTPWHIHGPESHYK
jgi:hypothetical protein